MSAFVVSPAHIDYLVQSAITLNRLDYGSVRFHGERVENCTATEVGAALLAANITSVSYRYPDSSIDDLPGSIPTPAAIDYRYRHSQYMPYNPVHVLSALACYEYQSCEHPSWETSEAHAFCERLRGAAIRHLPGYSDAPWEITESMMHPTRDQLRARIAQRRAA